MIIRLHHAQICIPTGAESEAREFYCRVLQLKEIDKPASLKGRGGFWIELGDVQIHFGVEDGVDRFASKSHLAYEVSNLDELRTKLGPCGIEVLEGVPIPGYDRIEFRDPFGNRVELLQRL